MRHALVLRFGLETLEKTTFYYVSVHFAAPSLINKINVKSIFFNVNFKNIFFLNNI